MPEETVTASQKLSALPLPALNFLGYSINLLTTSPLDISSVSRNILRTSKLIDPRADQSNENGIHGVLYNVPHTVNITTRTGTEENFKTWTTGSEVNKAFQADHTLYGKYGAISRPAPTIAPSYENRFLDRYQYGIFSHSSPLYSAMFTGDSIRLNEEQAILSAIQKLPKPFRIEDTTVQAYKNFFLTLGTHVIVECQYGSRFQLLAFAENSDIAVNNRFNANIRAHFDGIMSQGAYDPNVKTEAQYKRFQNLLQSVSSITGGDRLLAIEFLMNPPSYSLFSKWVNTTILGSHSQAMSDSNPIAFGCIGIWDLVGTSSHGDISSYADPLLDAFQYFSENPRVYRTSVTFEVVGSNWGEFGLLTPGVICQINPNKRTEDSEKWTVSGDRVVWGSSDKSNSGQDGTNHSRTIEFWLINDGSPIDFWVSYGHGPNERAGNGSAKVTVAGRGYEADKGTMSNKTEFYKAKVSSSPVYPRHTSKTNKMWNDILKEYLKEQEDGQFNRAEEEGELGCDSSS